MGGTTGAMAQIRVVFQVWQVAIASTMEALPMKGVKSFGGVLRPTNHTLGIDSWNRDMTMSHEIPTISEAVLRFVASRVTSEMGASA